MARSCFSPLAYLKAMRVISETLIRHRVLLKEAARQDIADKYAGQMLGILWAFIHPVLIMLVFLFLFAFALGMRIPESAQITQGWGGYVMYLLAGMVPWISLQEIMGRSVAAITSSSNLVKQVIFPLEVLPAKMLLSALLTQCISLGVYSPSASYCTGYPIQQFCCSLGWLWYNLSAAWVLPCSFPPSRLFLEISRMSYSF